MNIGERIKQVRKVMKLTQADFAEKIGLKPTAVLMYEKGNRNVSEQSIVLICQAFSVNEEWLRTGEGEMFAAQETLALDDPTLDDLDRAILQSYIKMPPARRAFFKEWVKEMIAVFSQTDAQKEKAAPEISEADMEAYDRVNAWFDAHPEERVKKEQAKPSAPSVESDAG